MADHLWKPIQDLPGNWPEFTNQDLHNLAMVWQERLQQLHDSDQLIDFNEKLTRQWAIETGIIERLYTLDRGITQLLIEKRIEASLIPHGTTNKSPALIVSIIRDQKEVIDGLFDFVSQRRKLSTSYIKQMHQVFTRNQITTDGINQFGQLVEVEIIHGDWKKWPNNPLRPDGKIYEYCPPEQVASEMDRLISLHETHLAQGVPPEVESAWLHHRFTQIHPFQDGNGRVARAVASLVFLRESWFPLVITNDMRVDYIDALEKADEGNLEPLVQLFSRIETTAFRNALSISEEIPIEKRSLDTLIGESLERIQEKRNVKQNHAFALAKELEQVTYQKLTDIAKTLDTKIKQIDPDFWVSVTKSKTGETDYWYRIQIVDIATKFNYFPNLSNYRSWVQLKIHEERIANITFSFHGLGAGSKFLGLMAVSAFIEFRAPSEGEDNGYEGPYQICRDIFQFTYQENAEELAKKFTSWLDETILIGVGEWQRRL
jgi:Fic family protein